MVLSSMSPWTSVCILLHESLHRIFGVMIFLMHLQGITHLNLQDTMSSTPAGSLTSASGPTLGPAQNENAPLNQLPTAYPASAPADQTTSVSRTVVLPGVGTQTVTVTTTRPSPAATQRAARDLVNFAQVHPSNFRVLSK